MCYSPAWAPLLSVWKDPWLSFHSWVLSWDLGVSPRPAWYWQSFCLLDFWSLDFGILCYIFLETSLEQTTRIQILSHCAPGHSQQACPFPSSLPPLCTHSPIWSRPRLPGFECFPLPFILWLFSFFCQDSAHVPPPVHRFWKHNDFHCMWALLAHGTYLYLQHSVKKNGKKHSFWSLTDVKLLNPSKP